MIETIIAKNSAITIDIHIPLIPIIKGKIITVLTWNTNVLRNDINADVTPSFNAVKKFDKKIANPANINENE